MTDAFEVGAELSASAGERLEAEDAIDARPVEYEAATLQWIYVTVDSLMRARDPLYARIGHERVESVPESRIELPSGEAMLVEPHLITATGTVQIGP